MQGNRTFLGQLLFRVRRITGSESCIVLGIGQSRFSISRVETRTEFDISRGGNRPEPRPFPPIKSSPVPRSSRAILKKTNFFRNRPCRDIRSPTYFVESRVQARISIYIYIYVALLEKESILDVNDVEAKKRKEKGRKAKRNGGDRAPARCTPHRHLSFRSSARPNIFRLYNKRSLCSHKLCKSMPRVI